MAGSKGSKYYNIFLDYSIWLASVKGQEIITEPNLRLLKLIHETHSLKEAAAAEGISYRKAWGDLKAAEEKLGLVLLEKTRGGKDGGHSNLSPEGANLLLAYDELKSDIDASIKKVTRKFFHNINQPKTQ